VEDFAHVLSFSSAMRRLAGVAGPAGLLSILCLAPAAAQTEPSTAAVVFAGAGGVTPEDAFTFWRGRTWRAGAGLEHRFASGFLLQGEIELLQRPDSPGDTSVWLPSIAAGYELGRAALRPFVSGGYTFVSGSAAFTIGGGVNVRLAPHADLRVELRDHRLIFDVPVDSYGVRVGLVFR
jgi:hypothetical protein